MRRLLDRSGLISFESLWSSFLPATKKMFLVDGHLDLSMNALEWNRDLTRPLTEIRRREIGQTDKKDRGRNVCTLEEMRRGEIGLCIATQIARYVAEGNSLPAWHSPEIAWA